MTIDEIRLLKLKSQREDMIRWLIEEKGFNPKAAPDCIKNFLETMEYVLKETGKLP